MLADAEEHVFLDARPHGIVLVRPLSRAVLATVVGGALLAFTWPLAVAGAALMGVGAVVAVRAVWRWERTRVVVTDEKVFVVHGVVRRRAAAVHLARVGSVEFEQSLPGRLLGYGTVVLGELEIEGVRRPGELCGLVQRLAG